MAVITLKHAIHIKNNVIFGADTLKLEKEAALFLGAAYGVMVERARDGVALSLEACGVGEGCTVLCPALGSTSTLSSIEGLGARAVFVDINPNTLNIDPFCLEYIINKSKRDRSAFPAAAPIALVAADSFGLPCNYPELTRICDEYGISLIEDMGGAFGASADGCAAGSGGRFAVASFFGASAPDGICPYGEEAMVLCRTEEDAEALRLLRGEGSVQQTIGGDWGSGVPGIIISEMMKRYDEELERRTKIAGWYTERLKGKLRLQTGSSGYKSAHTHFVIMLENEHMRAAVMDALSRDGIPCAIYYPNSLYSLRRGEYPAREMIMMNAEKASQRLLALPMHPYLSERVVDYICGKVLEYI